MSAILVSCTRNGNTAPTVPPSAQTAVAPVPTITATSEPMALMINGVGVTVAEYVVQKQQIVSAAQTAGKSLDDGEITELLNNYFIETELLAQAAVQAQYDPSEAELEAKLASLKEKVGGEEAFQAWLVKTGTSQEFFMLAFRRELAAQWQRDRITEQLGDTAEQIHAFQILVKDTAAANQVYSQLQGGMAFLTLAAQYDPVTKGDLGWFPRGYLFLPQIEEKIFALQPGRYTEVIQSEYGYHIILVEEREEDHPLSEAARLQLAHQALSAWLEEQKAGAAVEILLP